VPATEWFREAGAGRVRTGRTHASLFFSLGRSVRLSVGGVSPVTNEES